MSNDLLSNCANSGDGGQPSPALDLDFQGYLTWLGALNLYLSLLSSSDLTEKDRIQLQKLSDSAWDAYNRAEGLLV